MPIERNAVYETGPKFSGEKSEDGKVRVMFTNVIDGGNAIGPREATDADKDAHPAAYADFLEGKTSKAEIEAAQAKVKEAQEAATTATAAAAEAKKNDAERKAAKEKEAQEKANPAAKAAPAAAAGPKK
jgi:trigger factor